MPPTDDFPGLDVAAAHEALTGERTESHLPACNCDQNAWPSGGHRDFCERAKAKQALPPSRQSEVGRESSGLMARPRHTGDEHWNARQIREAYELGRLRFLLGEWVRFATEGVTCTCPTGDLAKCGYCEVADESEEMTRAR